MKRPFLYILIPFLLLANVGFSQTEDNAAILKVLLSKYYANEKVIKPGRLQLLSFYCNQSPNNEEVYEVINSSETLQKHAAEIKKQIKPSLQRDWSGEFNLLFSTENQYLKSKVNDCLSLEAFQEYSKRLNLNNQRLMIVGIPMFFGKNQSLVKVTFYRNIEHNSGSYFLLQKENGKWIIKETLNAWST